MHLIGINGFKRSGKGTVANIVAALYNDGDATVKGVGFADKLKILAARSLGLTALSEQGCVDLMDEFKEFGLIDYYNATLTINGNLTGREYLQNIGNEARGIFGDTFWIDMVLPDPAAVEGWDSDRGLLLERRYPGVDCLCITDLRYPNEAERVKALGGVNWEVIRPGVESDGHASEQTLPRDLVDYVIDNSGSLADLELAVERAMDTLPAA